MDVKRSGNNYNLTAAVLSKDKQDVSKDFSFSWHDMDRAHKVFGRSQTLTGADSTHCYHVVARHRRFPSCIIATFYSFHRPVYVAAHAITGEDAKRYTHNGKEYAEADYTRVAFELDKGPKLAVFPVYEKQKPTMTGWQLTRAMRSWSWHGCDGQETEIELYARGDSVELFVNGKSVGKKSLKGKCRVLFRAAYEAGELTAVSYNASGKEIGRDVLRTCGAKTQLCLEAEKAECAPGEMVYFRIRCTDETGETNPMEKQTVTVSAENGVLMGTVNGSCSYSGNFAGDTVPTYFGEAQAIVCADAPGVVRVTARSAGMEASAEVICKG